MEEDLSLYNDYGVYRQLGKEMLPTEVKSCQVGFFHKRGVGRAAEVAGIVGGIVAGPVAFPLALKYLDPVERRRLESTIPEDIMSGKQSIKDYYCEKIKSDAVGTLFGGTVVRPVDMQNVFTDWSPNQEIGQVGDKTLNYFELAAYYLAKDKRNGAKMLYEEFFAVEPYQQMFTYNCNEMLLMGSRFKYIRLPMELSYDVLINNQKQVLDYYQYLQDKQPGLTMEEFRKQLTVQCPTLMELQDLDSQEMELDTLTCDTLAIIPVHSAFLEMLCERPVVSLDAGYQVGSIVYLVTLDGTSWKKYKILGEYDLPFHAPFVIHPYQGNRQRFASYQLKLQEDEVGFQL